MNLKGRLILLKYIVFSFFILVSSSAFSERTSQVAFSALNALQPSDYVWIGDKIYQNEAASNPKYLTHWGKGEAFPSFGIAHFIWFPADAKNSTPEHPLLSKLNSPCPPPSFKETFPAMFELVSKNSPPPKWLERLWLQSQINPNLAFDAPWSNKVQFDAAQSSPEIQSLRSWLLATQAQQARFVVQGFEQRWLKETASLSPEKRHTLNRRLQRMMGFKQGLFSAVDYFNFKGLGNNSKEQYQGKSWGLISVLEGMPSTVFTPDASDLQRLQAFITSAKHQLQQRTMLAPKSRNEARWIKGWFKRLDGYALEDNHE